MNRFKLAALLLTGTSMTPFGSTAFAQATAGSAAQDATVAAPVVPEASTAEAAAAPAAPAGEIVVTGSRTVKNGNSSPSPVTVVATDDILKVQPGTLADALNLLPVFAGSRGTASNPSSTGTAAGGNGSANQLNLRNIGANRTLILLDGLRVPPTTFNGIVDVDLIPQMLVQRVDTVTGGVSAVYGSDAIAGVVNYVINRKFQGVEVRGTEGISQRGDAGKTDLAIAAGAGLFGGRGHIEGSYEYRNEKGILARSERPDFYLYGVSGSVPGSTAAAGTAANPYQNFANLRQAGFPFGGLITNGPLTGQTFDAGGVLRPFVAGTRTGTAALQVGGDGGYYDSSLLAPLRSDQLFGRFDFDVTDNIHFYAQVGGNLKTNRSFAEYVQISNFTFSRDNPYLAQTYRNQLGAVTTFRLSELISALPRLEAESKSDQWIYMTGFEGKLGTFDWGVNYTHGDTDLKTTLATNVNTQRLAAALDVVTSPTTGQPVCYASTQAATATAYANCVPLNVFGPGAASAAAAAYVLQPTHYAASTKLDDVSGHIEGSPFATWAGDVNVAFSGEYRKLSFKSASDALPTTLVDCSGLRFTGTGAGTNCTPGNALYSFTFAGSPKVSQNVKEAAFEATVPLVRDVSFIQALDINGAARYTKYNTSGDYWTWKLGFDWHVTDNFRLRGTRSRDIRAPTLFELFAPLNAVPVQPVDLLTGLSPRVPSVDQSNPDLKAEIGNTLTGGFVWTPLPRLTLTVDGYHITVSDAITQISGSTPAYQQACYASGGTSPYCALQDRTNGFTDTSAANVIRRWLTKYYNLSEIETYGADVEVNYTASLFSRPASLRILGAYQPHVYYRQPPIPTTDQGGVAFGPGGLSAGPSVRVTAFARFQPVEHVTVDLLERWRNHMKLGGDPTQYWVSNRIGSFATTNLTLTYDFATDLARGEIFLNVQNVFDRSPPGGGYSGNGTRAGLRDGFALGDDPIGRYFNAGVRVKF